MLYAIHHDDPQALRVAWQMPGSFGGSEQVDPVATAVVFDSSQCMRELIALHVDLNCPSRSGDTPLMLAEQMGSQKTADLLRAAGARDTREARHL